MSYRSVNYRDAVLWALAYRLGLDPTVELLVDQASALDSYINAWVRKSWDAVDWPEWTTIGLFTPDGNHVVPYALPTTPLATVISRVFKVFLVDPHVTQGPADTPFRLYDTGVHCGFEHGTNVWIRYIPNAPQFTSVEWLPSTSFNAGDLTYSPITGQSYQSNQGNNKGNDPSTNSIGATQLMIVQQTQAFVPSLPAVPAKDEIWDYNIGAGNYYLLSGTRFIFNNLFDSGGATHFLNYTVPSAGMTPAAIIAGIAAAATASGDTFLQSLSFVQDGTTATLMHVHCPTQSFSDLPYPNNPPGSHILSGTTNVSMGQTETQKFVPATAAVPAVPQLWIVYFNIQPGSTYTIKVVDSTGALHTATYASLASDTASQIIQGIMSQFNLDPFLQTLPLTPNFTNATLQIASPVQPITLAASLVFGPTAPWSLVLFPFALVDIVLRGAYADCLKEWGQTEKAAAEEKGATEEAATRGKAFLAPQFDKLSDQMQPKPRYTVT